MKKRERGTVRIKDIHPQLRLIGCGTELFMPFLTRKTMPMANRFMTWFIQGKWLGRHSKVTTEYVLRPDGTRLRLLVCRAKKAAERQRKDTEWQKKDTEWKKKDAAATGLLWIHGGGYAVGLPEQDYLFVDRFVKDGSTVAVLPDYAKSTEKPYPAALEDCYLALRWMKEHASELGVNPAQLFVGGDSAGGGLTAALTLYARDRGEITIAFQMPLYPMIDDRMITKSSQNNNAPVWNSRRNREAWEMYLSGIRGENTDGGGDGHGSTSQSRHGEVPYYAAPARAEDLRNLPPMCTYVGDIEPFFDETVAYAAKMKEAGGRVSLRVYKGCFHAFDLMGYPTRPAKNAREYLMHAYRYAQEHYFTEQ